ncbi:MAG: hypothetical protein KatS3mg119_1864 [Rhodothalassiaceae bacterium]|nr:MAG: hypothetical protein KatS3mg119_1864 [Rhodothalassiaceae bacterium]
MQKDDLINALASALDISLATQIVSHFLELKKDVISRRKNSTSIGKFTETFVQCHQYLATGNYDTMPNVDRYLCQQAENQGRLPDGLRICAPRVARVIYTFRNKRNIAHISDLDQNVYDIETAYHCAVWIMSEMLRELHQIPMDKAALLIKSVQESVSHVVEIIDGSYIVHGGTSIPEKIILLLSHVPDGLDRETIWQAVKTAKKETVYRSLRRLENQILVHLTTTRQYVLTTGGQRRARDIIAKIAET